MESRRDPDLARSDRTTAVTPTAQPLRFEAGEIFGRYRSTY